MKGLRENSFGGWNHSSSHGLAFGIRLGLLFSVLCLGFALPVMAQSPLCGTTGSSTHTLYIDRVQISAQVNPPVVSLGDSHHVSVSPNDTGATNGYLDVFGAQGTAENLMAQMDTGGGTSAAKSYTITVTVVNATGLDQNINVCVYIDKNGNTTLGELPYEGASCQTNQFLEDGVSFDYLITVNGRKGYDLDEAGMRVIVSENSITDPCASNYGNGETEDFKIRFKPTTFVELSSFTAKGFPGGVRLGWETLSEKNCAGFYLLRSNRRNGEYARISDLIAPLGDEFVGASYTYEDTDGILGKRYFYKLEDIDSSTGESAFHGPIPGKAKKIRK